jgi:FAD/FMN-containing dehydrogenase
VITPADPVYDKARTVFYPFYDRRPAVIVRPADSGDVSKTVLAAAATGLELAVRSGGHSVPGHSTTEGGILLDLTSMTRLDIDVDGRSAWAETGRQPASTPFRPPHTAWPPGSETPDRLGSEDSHWVVVSATW